MSSFFDEASLVFIPSGYKTSKAYSVKPTSGDGDLAFTRSNDTATRVGPDGLIEKVRTNVALYSEQFDNAYWGKSNVTVTANTTVNPVNGATTADTLTRTGGVSGFLNKQIAQTGIVTFSIFAKAGTTNEVRLNIFDGSTDRGATYNLTTGAISSVYGSPLFTTAQSFGNGWYRISISVNSASYTDCQVQIDSVNSVIIFGAQLETGDIATDYIATTSAAVSVGPVANVPRLDYLNSSCPRLLLEPQRTNSVTSSENIATGWSYTNAAISVNQTASPDGLSNADAIVPNATSGQHAINSANITASGSFTLSAFVKAGEYTKVAIRESANTGSYASFNLATGTKIEDNVSGASFIQSYGNGWYRIGVTGTFSGTIRLGINVLSNAYTTGNPSSGTTFFSGNASDKLFCWGMQAELGATYATSYIPTLGAAVTRGAEGALNFSALVNNTSFTLFFEGSYTKADPDFFDLLVGVNQFSGNYFSFYNGFIAIYNAGGGTQTFGTALAPNTVHKLLIKYDGTTAKYYRNGSLFLSIPATGLGTFADGYIYNNDQEGLKVNQLLYFPTALSDADCAALTA